MEDGGRGEEDRVRISWLYSQEIESRVHGYRDTTYIRGEARSIRDRNRSEKSEGRNHHRTHRESTGATERERERGPSTIAAGLRGAMGRGRRSTRDVGLEQRASGGDIALCDPPEVLNVLEEHPELRTYVEDATHRPSDRDVRVFEGEEDRGREALRR